MNVTDNALLTRDDLNGMNTITGIPKRGNTPLHLKNDLKGKRTEKCLKTSEIKFAAVTISLSPASCPYVSFVFFS